jgi:hypothetical protein
MATARAWERFGEQMQTLTRRYAESRRRGMARIFVSRAGIRNLEDWRPLVRWYWQGRGSAYCSACGKWLADPEAIAMEILRHESGGYIHPGCGAWGNITRVAFDVTDPASATAGNYRLYRQSGVRPWGGYLK